MKINGLLKKMDYRLKQLEWIEKKRKNLPGNIQKRLSADMAALSKIVKTKEKSQLDFESVKRAYAETERDFKTYFDKYKQNWFAELFDELWLVVVIALLLKFFVIGSFRVPTGSMVNTIEIGDNLFVAMFVYGLTLPFASRQFIEFRDPERGEIITFTEPGPEKKALVKRVVGIPGDAIFLSGKDVFVNGKKLSREESGKVIYTSSRGEKETTTQYIETNESGKKYKVIYNDKVSDERRAEIENYSRFCNRSFTVPPRSYFVLGDNRDDSLDSRYWGFVPRENLQGKPLFVWFSVQFGKSIFDVIDLRLGRIGRVFE